MPEYKFVYTVSGMTLSDEHRSRISEEIAVAVTRVILSECPGSLQMNYTPPHPICGGSHRRTEDTDPGDPGAEPSSEQPSAEQLPSAPAHE